MKMLDFPKGKANQGEQDVACAIREIKEEIDLDVSTHINASQFISVQTLKEKYVTLYIIQIDETNVQTKLKKIDEVQELKWIPVSEFM
jgi:mRNA-decapping enzyme subunit 2